MQGSRLETKAPWRQSVIKNNQSNSRIFNDSKELFHKFSPTKDPNPKLSSKSLIKPKPANTSIDEQQLSPKNKDRSFANQFNQQENKKLKAKASNNSIKMNLINSSEDYESIINLKSQFKEFKEKILRQLSKQQQLIKRTIRQICQVLKKINPNIDNQLRLPFSSHSQPKSISKSFSLQPMKNKQPFRINLATYREHNLTSSETKLQFQSVLPQIKQKMNKLAQFVDGLKKQMTNSIFQGSIIADLRINNGEYSQT